MSNVNELYINNDKSLMIIDDDDVFRNRLITAMKRKGYEAFGASSVSEAINLVNNTDYYCFSFNDFKKENDVKYENIPDLYERVYPRVISSLDKLGINILSEKPSDGLILVSLSESVSYSEQVSEELSKLTSLRDRSIITESEYLEKRQIIMSKKTVEESSGFFDKLFGGDDQADTIIVRVSQGGEKGEHTLVTIENESYTQVQTSPTEELIRGLYANLR